MDVGTPRIGPEQALEIAKEIKKGERKEIPKWLNQSEKEMVETSLDFLLAADKALKAWWVKSNYLEKKREATLRRKNSQLSRQRFIEVSTTLSTVSSLSLMIGGEFKAFNDRLDRLLTDYAEKAFKAEKMAGKARLRTWFRRTPYSQFAQRMLATQFWVSLRNSLSPGLTQTLAEKWGMKTGAKAAEAVSRLSETGKALSNEFYEKYVALLREDPRGRSPEASMAIAYTVSRNDPAWEEPLDRLYRAKEKFEEVTQEAEKEEAEAKRKCKFAGTFYIIAAMGEFMEGLARSIG